ncbi:MAG: hypothetical protein KGI50_07390 [Patescibacteria group bacterium]|nr:hypothetical protein [Patescibacteria group bacterium]
MSSYFKWYTCSCGHRYEEQTICPVCKKKSWEIAPDRMPKVPIINSKVLYKKVAWDGYIRLLLLAKKLGASDSQLAECFGVPIDFIVNDLKFGLQGNKDLRQKT